MRILLSALLLVALPLASAQDDACTQTTPCPWTIVVDETGITESSQTAITQGDWFTITLHNDDLTQTHTVNLSGYDVTLQATALSDAQKTVQFSMVGKFTVTDKPTGKTAPFEVITGDAVDYENGVSDASGNPTSSAAPKKAPGLELPLVALAVAGLALARRK